LDPVRLQECDRLSELRVRSHLDAERHARRVLGQAERSAELPREETDTVMLAAAAQEHRARAAIHDLLALHESEMLGVERLGPVHVGDEQAHRADPRDLERPRQQYPLDVVRLGQRLARAVTGEEVDALAERFGHLRDLGHLWQWWALPETSVVHHLRL